MVKSYGFIQRAERLRALNERITAASYARRYIDSESERAQVMRIMTRDKNERRALLGV